MPPVHRIATLVIDDAHLPPPSPAVEQERNIAIFDLLEANDFAPLPDGPPVGPYAVTLALEGRTLVLAVAGEGEARRIGVPYAPFRRAARAYHEVVAAYQDAIRTRGAAEIERLDEGRRQLHGEGAALVAERLSEQARMDDNTARRLFTLIASLTFRG